MDRERMLRYPYQSITILSSCIWMVVILCALNVFAADAPGQDSLNMGDSLKETIQRANRLYSEGDFEDALSGYDEALKHGVDNGYIYYNRANTYFRLGSFGRAIANYHRARQLLPRNAEVFANLELARKKAPGHYSESESERSAQSKLFAGLLSYQEIKLGAIVSAVLFWSLFIVWRLRPLTRFLVPLLGTFVLTTSFICSYLFTRYSPLSGFEWALSSQSRAIGGAVVLERELKVYAGNSQTFQVIYILKEGAEIETREERESWIQVGLPGGRVGWVQKDGLEII